MVTEQDGDVMYAMNVGGTQIPVELIDEIILEDESVLKCLVCKQEMIGDIVTNQDGEDHYAFYCDCSDYEEMEKFMINGGE